MDSVATVVTVETPERVSWLWIARRHVVTSSAPGLSPPQLRVFFSRFSGCCVADRYRRGAEVPAPSDPQSRDGSQQPLLDRAGVPQGSGLC